MDYSRTFGSNYPNECIPLGTHKDVDNTVVNLINKYNSYVQTGDMILASTFYEQNKTLLEPYVLNINYINRLEEEIYNTGLYAMEKGGNGSNKSVVSDTEPTEQDVNAFWFQDY